MYRLAIAGLPYFVAIAVCVIWLARIYHLSSIDLTIPFGWFSDHNFIQMMVRNFVRGGHFFINPLLGAPGQQELYDFPLPEWVHFGVLAVIRLFTRNFGLATNILYLLSYPLAAVTCLYAFRRIGISPGLATAGAVLFAFLPYHLLRNEGHLIFSCYYLVPLMGLIAIWVGTGRDIFLLQRSVRASQGLGISTDGAIAILTCFLVGWDNPYYTFFGAFLLVIAGLLGWLWFGTWRAPVAAVILLIVMVSSFGAALLPTTLYIHGHGRSPVAQRAPVESEMYALTIIQLLSPVTNHRISALANWKNHYNAQAVMVNENDWASLGAVGAAGFVALLICLFRRNCSPVLYCLAILCLFATLLGTIGGLGAVFSFVISPQIRAFNRISVHIGFLCVAATMLILDRTLSDRSFVGRNFLYFVFVPLLLVVVGVHDQVPRGIMPMVARRQVEKLFRQDEQFIKRIESLVPAGSMIFQLPYCPFPENPPINNMADYDELKGYLHSDSLRWSYAAMRTRPTDRWLATVSAYPVDRMLSAIADAGFAGLYIDRNGYKDHGRELEEQVKLLLGQEPIVGEDERLSFFLISQRAVAFLKQPITPEKSAYMDKLLHPLIVDVGSGCWAREGNDVVNWYWCGADGEIVVTNPSRSDRGIEIQATFVTGHKDASNLQIEGGNYKQELPVDNIGLHWTAKLKVPPGTTRLHFWCNCNRVIAPSDSRELFLQVRDLKHRALE
jgi:phosphoglycerol transferase